MSRDTLREALAHCANVLWALLIDDSVGSITLGARRADVDSAQRIGENELAHDDDDDDDDDDA